MTHVTCRLTAKNRDQFQNPTLGNRVWATFTFYNCYYDARTHAQTDEQPENIMTPVTTTGQAQAQSVHSISCCMFSVSRPTRPTCVCTDAQILNSMLTTRTKYTRRRIGQNSRHTEAQFYRPIQDPAVESPCVTTNLL